MPDEIEVNEAPEEEVHEAPDIVIAPVIVNDTPASEVPTAAYITREEFDTYCREHAESGHGDMREQIGALAGIEALLVEDEIVEQQALEEQPPVKETTIEGEGEVEAPSERHASIWL